jgi:hypothetical protein
MLGEHRHIGGGQDHTRERLLVVPPQLDLVRCPSVARSVKVPPGDAWTTIVT